MLKTKIINILPPVIVGVLIGGFYLYAAPKGPPSDQVAVPLPLTQSDQLEVKKGALTVQNTITANRICLGSTNDNNCKTSWPTASINSKIIEVSGKSGQISCYSPSGYHSFNYCYKDNYSGTSCNSTSGNNCNAQFSVSIPVSVSGVALTASNLNVTCHPSRCDYDYWTGGYNCTLNEYYFSQAVKLSYSFDNNNNLTISGECLIFDLSGNRNAGYVNGGAKVNKAVVKYIY